MSTDWHCLPAVVARGYRVASSPSKEYPYGTLERQRPLFKARGLDLAPYYNGTLNLDLRPYRFEMLHPQFTFERVEWTDLHPPETFSFSRCAVVFQGLEYDGWVYYPHPETKQRHFQDPSLLEVIAKPIAGLAYGDRVEVRVNPREIAIRALNRSA